MKKLFGPCMWTSSCSSIFGTRPIAPSLNLSQGKFDEVYRLAADMGGMGFIPNLNRSP